MNVFADEWEDLYPQMEGWRSNVRRLVPPGNALGGPLWTVHRLDAQVDYFDGEEAKG